MMRTPTGAWRMAVAGAVVAFASACVPGAPPAPTSPTAPPVVASSSPSLPTGVMIQGYTYSQEDVARTLARLQLVPDLGQVSLQTSATAKLGLRDVVQFAIVAEVRTPGAGS